MLKVIYRLFMFPIWVMVGIIIVAIYNVLTS